MAEEEEFKTEAGALSTKLQMVHASRLSTLLKKIKWEERALHGVSKASLLAVAEQVLGNAAYSRGEYGQAIILLARYLLAHLVDRRHPIRCKQLIEKERQKNYLRRCARCGLIITAEESLKTGYGSVCRKKVGKTLPRTEGVGQQ